jgi:hypothetical protein
MLMKGSIDKTVLPIYEVLKKSLNFHLNKDKKKTDLKKLSIGHTLLLLQNIVAVHGQHLPTEELKWMMGAVVDLLYPKHVQRVVGGETKTKTIIFDRVLLARAFNLQFLCNMYAPDQSLLKSLIKYHDLRIFYGYDVSVIFECMKHLIMKEQNMLNIAEILKILIRIIYCYMEMDTELKIHNINEKDRKIMNANSLHDDSDPKIED